MRPKEKSTYIHIVFQTCITDSLGFGRDLNSGMKWIWLNPVCQFYLWKMDGGVDAQNINPLHTATSFHVHARPVEGVIFLTQPHHIS